MEVRLLESMRMGQGNRSAGMRIGIACWAEEPAPILRGGVLPNEESISAKKGIDLVYEEQSLGEYGIGWVVEKIDGKEVARHNVMHLMSIQWMEE